MNDETIWEEGPAAMLARRERLCIPLSIRDLVVLLHELSVLLR